MTEDEQNIKKESADVPPAESWWKRNRNQTGKFAVVIAALAAVTAGCFFMLRAAGFTNAEGLQSAMEGSGIWIYGMYLGLYVLQAVLLSVMPGNTALFVSAGYLIFSDFWTALILAVIGNQIASIIIFFIGRHAGRKVLYWLFDKEKFDKRLDEITDKGLKVVPALFLIPLFPNDLVCLACGASKMRFWQYMLIVAFFRTIEVFLLLAYPVIGQFFVKGRAAQDVILFINIVVIDIFLISLYYKMLIKLFKKHILRKKYHMVKADYYVEEETAETKRHEHKDEV